MGRTFVFVTPRPYVATSQDIRNELTAFSFWESESDWNDDLCDADEVITEATAPSRYEFIIYLVKYYLRWTERAHKSGE